MKKMTNVEVKVINLNANDVIATSGDPVFGSSTISNASAIGVDARGYYEDEEEEIW